MFMSDKEISSQGLASQPGRMFVSENFVPEGKNPDRLDYFSLLQKSL